MEGSNDHVRNRKCLCRVCGGPVKKCAPSLEGLLRPIRLLTQDPKNARLHPEANLKSIEISLHAHGQQKPIVVHKGVVVAGNGTLEAAKRLGWTDIACVEYDGTEAQARAYALADNRSSDLAAYDEACLASALREADAEGILESTGYDEGSFADALSAADRAVSEFSEPAFGATPEMPDKDMLHSIDGKDYRIGVTICCGVDRPAAECDVIRRRWTKFALENNIDPGESALE